MFYMKKQGFNQSQELKNELEAKPRNEPRQNPTQACLDIFLCWPSVLA